MTEYPRHLAINIFVHHTGSSLAEAADWLPDTQSITGEDIDVAVTGYLHDFDTEMALVLSDLDGAARQTYEETE